MTDGEVAILEELKKINNKLDKIDMSLRQVSVGNVGANLPTNNKIPSINNSKDLGMPDIGQEIKMAIQQAHAAARQQTGAGMKIPDFNIELPNEG